MKYSALILTTILTLAACNQQDEAEKPVAQLAEYIVDAPVSPGISVMNAKTSAQPGDNIVVTGRIAGAKEPFSEDFATLILADDSLRTCDRIPGDTCPTPWDACCVEPETIQASRLLVQLVGDDGLPIDASLKGVGGLKELDEITVVGSVDASSTPSNVIINAVKIHRPSSAR